MHDVAVGVAEHLDLDVARPNDSLLQIHGVVCEGRLRFAARASQGRLELVLGVDEAHPPPAAAGRRLQHDRITDARRGGLGLLGGREAAVLATVVPRDDRDTGGLHQRPCRRLAAHRPDSRRGRPDEHRARRGDGLCKVRVLRQEAVPGMDRVGAARAERGQQLVHRQIALAGGRGAEPDGLVGHPHVHGLAIGVGVDRHGGDAELPARPHDPARDLASVRDQDLADGAG